jgi:hypothetical protein
MGLRIHQLDAVRLRACVTYARMESGLLLVFLWPAVPEFFLVNDVVSLCRVLLDVSGWCSSQCARQEASPQGASGIAHRH